ncbi:RNA polymerase sigma-70 factor [Paenibacillus sacheonensis]|uniref:RNA polymerase sigma-70 factor n=1 Tax=Paenibacillus sacheonensis TaxID=742054 RepID=A0A7X5C2U2_9BACL|nr:RNA polymerase sigma-70 factor (ECF subfamily) [Paenibacillus sacheonensis]NBC70744.1 RNA polymerase sigma-70 factor [Paenibacillus sacheonensis]
MELDSVYKTYRPLLLSIAYRMLGSVTQAEDLVQDAFVTVQQQNIHQEGGSIRNLKAYLCKIVTNRCLDDLKSARKNREVYVGPWLPEPLVQDYVLHPGTAAGQDPLQRIVLEDTISYAFLIMLERLTPIERAVFILREAFEFEYRDIADFVDKTELGCRQIFSRLKRKIQEDRPQPEAIASERSEQLVLRFLHATATGDMEGLFAMLADDIVLYNDGGGKVFAAVKPIVSSRRALAFIQGILSKDNGLGRMRMVKINGQLGVVLSSPSESYPTIVSLELRDGRVQRIYILRNPDKMQHLNLSLLS